MGGVTRVVLDANTFERISSNLVLVGTHRNCAGGMSPWGWLTCEEDITPGHGYVFVCPTDATSVQEPHRVPAYGRFNHEAAVVDPSTHIAYLTEDRPQGCLYRAVPSDFDNPFDARLQALRVIETDEFATTDMQVGDVVDVDWVDIEDADPLDDDVRTQAKSAGAAIFVRGEGILFHEGSVYVCCTSGGSMSGGQVFRLIDDASGSTLELVAASSNLDTLYMPDNIAMAPWGQLFVVEDNSTQNHIRGLTEDGEVFDFARNAEGSGEFAGICFSPDGRAMFVNMQTAGLTLVVTGPFPEVPDPGEGTGSDSGDGGNATSGDGTGGDGGAATTGDAAETGSSGGASGGAGMMGSDGGCACAADSSRSSVGAVATVAGLGALASARRGSTTLDDGHEEG